MQDWTLTTQPVPTAWEGPTGTPPTVVHRLGYAPPPPLQPGASASTPLTFEFGPWTVLNSAGQPALDPQSALTATVRGPDTGRLGELLLIP